jgi:DNA modification methylase
MTDKHQIADDLTTLAYPIEKLKHLDGNPRKGNVEAVKKSYEKFGQRKPIVATKDGEVISGNHQLAAARELGWDKIAVVFTDDDELTAKAFALADNRTADLGTYDDDLLADMLGSVSSDLELLEATSFDEKDLMALIKKQEVIEDDAPAIRQTEIKLGQKYKLGNHTLVCGDATNKEHIDYLIKDNVIDLVFTDPPYGNGKAGHYGRGELGHRTIKNDKDFSTFQKYLQINNFKEIIFFLQWRTFDICLQTLKNNDYKLKSIGVWDKKNASLGQGLAEQWEAIFFVGNLDFTKFGGNVFNISREYKKRKNSPHPHQKPIFLLVDILNFLQNYKNVLDVFGGSGSTLIACEQLERNCFIMELDTQYCQVIIDRWEKFTGQKAELIESL